MIKNTAIIGMGALGLLYADLIARGDGPDAVSFIMNKERIEKYSNVVFSVNGKSVKFKLVSEEDAPKADLLIVAVKYTALPSAYPLIKKCCGEKTIVLSVMNGISSEKLIRENCGVENIVYTVAQGMDAMKFGNALTYTKTGELHIGALKNGSTAALETVCAYFDSIGMPYVKEDDILRRLWFKYMLNVGINQTCMIDSVGYVVALTPGTQSYMTFISAMREVIAIANAEGIELNEDDIKTTVSIIKTLDPAGTPSMGQDRISKRRSEVDMFAGNVIELGKKHGIPVPVNEYIYKRVKEIEAEY